jgi:hypothetical protein
MIPKSLSASAIQNFSCPARYWAENIERTPAPDNSAAGLGTVCHSALEDYVTGSGLQAYLVGDEDRAWGSLVDYFTKHYDEDFPERTRYDEGLDMMRTWFDRQDWENRTVESTEVKESITFETSVGPIPFNYIMDRVDRIDNGDGTFDIEVVDYKSVALPIQPAELANKVQARCYSMAARMRYPEARRIWVTFDLLRHDAVSTQFTVDQDRATWSYIRSMFERIIAEPEPGRERLNDTCRWCVRRHACATLTEHAAGGGVLGITDPNEAAERRSKIAMAQAALNTMADELDAVVLAHAEQNELLGWETDDSLIEITASRKRSIDTAMAARVVGPELVAKYGNLTMAAFDKLMKTNELNPDDKEKLRGLVRRKAGKPSVKVTPKNPIDMEE